MCFGKAPKPDPLIGQAQYEMFQLSQDQWNTFKTQILPDMLSQSREFNAYAQRYMQSMTDDANFQREIGQSYYNRMRDKFWPVEDKMIKEASTAGGVDDQQQMARSAQADVQTAIGNQRGAIQRAAARQTGDPTSGAASQALASTVVPAAAIQVQAMQGARQAAKNLGWAKKADVANMGRGLPSAQATSAGLAASMGQGAAGVYGASLAGLGNTAGAMANSANSSLAGYAGSGRLGLGLFDANMQRYQSKVNFWGDIIGGALGAGGTWAGGGFKMPT